jgi:hypothetical protein
MPLLSELAILLISLALSTDSEYLLSAGSLRFMWTQPLFLTETQWPVALKVTWALARVILVDDDEGLRQMDFTLILSRYT